MQKAKKNRRGRSTGKSKAKRWPIEGLESRLMMAANPVISEFMASNSTTLADGNGNYGDWIEIQNTGDASANLGGWHLSDDPTNPSKWTFPTTTLAAGGFLVVFADGTNTTDPAGYLHTNFSLSASGETLELTRTDLTVASEWNSDGTNYPPQQTDVSYGTGTIYHNTSLIVPGAASSTFVPTNNSLDANQWTAISYNTSGWTTGPTGIGYDTGGYEDNSVAPTLLADWNADDLAATISNGGKVPSWVDEVARAGANAGSAATDPTFVTSDFNGHAGVRFSAANSTQLRVNSSVNPMAGAGDFTVAFVFKTTTGTNSRSEWYNNAGIVDGEETGSQNDWGTAVSSSGYLGGGIGNPDTTVYTNTPSGASVTNGVTHVGVFTRQGGTDTIYVDGGNGVSSTSSAAARDVEDMVFGSLQTNLNYFTGDLAEVQIFDGAETTAAKAYAVALPLASKYGSTLTVPTTTSTPTLTGDWIGDSLTSTGNNASVSNWTSTANSKSINASSGSTATAPIVETNQLNGHTVVHFAGASSDQLRVTSSVNPMSNASNFTVVVAFRTTTSGAGSGTNWFDNTGIVDAEQSGVTNDWGLAINSSGQIGAGLGNPDETDYSGGLLDDGNAHVAIYTRVGAVTDLYIDGSSTPYENDDGGTAVRNTADMVFGSIQTGLNYFTGDIAEVQIYGGALTSDQAGALGHTLDSTYGVVSAPSPYAPYIATNIQTAMFGKATTADIRVPFTVSGSISQYSRLQLTMQYDDGFVAYVNGTEVLRENAPTGAITYQSVALGVRPKSTAITPQTIDLSAYLGLLVGNGGTNILSIKALNTSLTDPDLLMLPQLTIATATVGPAYFTDPTPGTANTTDGFTGFVSEPAISVVHGYYSSTFTTTLSDTTPGATIYYTTDGSDPSPTNGIAIAPASGTATASGGVTISASTPLRAEAYLDAFIPSTISTVTYIFVSSVLNQTNTAPAGAYWSTAVNPAIVNLSQTYSVAQSLTAIPSMSLVLPYADIFGPLGIYPNPTERGDAWEKETSLEYFDPNNASASFQIDAGLRIQGGNDRNGGASDPKKSFRLFFRSEYGASQLDYPIFGTSDPQQSFDHILLKAIHNYSWANAGGTDPTQGDLVRDSFARELQEQLTGHSAEDKWVQLYINGQYWGLYDCTEEPDSTWAAANYGGSKSDYDVVQPDGSGGVEVVDGSGTAYQNLFTTIAADFSDSSISASEYAALQPLVDMKGLVDYMLNVFYRGDQDAPVLIGDTTSPRNFYAFRDAATNGPFEFTTWDGELGLGDVNYNRTTVAGNVSPGTLFQDLKTNPDFAQLVADETYRLFYNNGPLESNGSIDNPMTTYDADAAQINIAIVGESARWGDTQGVQLTRDGDWVPEINNLNTNYFPQRSAIVLGQLKAITQFAMLGILPPSFYVNGTSNRGGTVAAGASLSLLDTNSSTSGDAIYYTLNGTDPRLSGGGISSAAYLYTGAFPITATETVTIRILNGTTWSPIDSATYGINQPASASNIAITELNYHPNTPSAAELAINSAWTDSDFEFIELLNTSNQPVDLTGAKFDSGVTLTFGTMTIAAGQRVVVVSNPAAFQARYGTSATIVGTYTGHLSNSGDTVDLKSASGAVISNFAYVDSWYPRTDGNGSTLEVVSTTGNYNLASNWRASYEVNGTPGTAGSPVTDVVINEVVSAPATGQQDAVELYNTTAATIDISGWFLSDSTNALTDYTFPAGSTIPASGYFVVTAAAFDNASSPTAFGLNGTSGDSVYLTKPSSTQKPYAFADSDTFGTSAIGESFGRVVTSTGTYFYPQASITLGAPNSGPRIGPVDITEFVYNTTGANANLQYVELQNQTNAVLSVGGWSFSNGITYAFPAGTTLAPYEAVTLVHFNPTTDTTNLAAFRAAYGIDSSLRLLGPFTDKLSSKGEEVTLVRPDAPRPDNPGYTPLILVDDFTFGIASPWPVTAVGQAVTRLSNHTFGEDPTNWSAQAPSIDTVAYGNAWFEGTTHYTYTSPVTLDSLQITGTSVVTLNTGAASATTVGGLTIATGATLDLANHALIDTATNSSEYLLLNQAAGLSFNHTVPWACAGLISSTAGADTSHLTAIGVIQNTNSLGQQLYGSGTLAGLFEGQSPPASATLVKVTYFGDANLDGKVDGSDYSLIDSGFLTHATGWFNGDFNYDGVINGSDYTLIDNAYNRQSASFASQIASVSPKQKRQTFVPAMMSTTKASSTLNDWTTGSVAAQIFTTDSSESTKRITFSSRKLLF